VGYGNGDPELEADPSPPGDLNPTGTEFRKGRSEPQGASVIRFVPVGSLGSR